MLATEIASGRAVRGLCSPHDAARRLTRSAHCGLRRPAAILCHASEVKAPSIRLDFQTSEGPTTLDCESGDILRDVMLAQKVDLYTTWGKVWSCGGNGQCGTCIVKVIDGSNLISERNSTEDKKLKRKPDSYRLACQTNVGDGTNMGTITLQTKPP